MPALILTLFLNSFYIYPQTAPGFPRLVPDAKALEYFHLWNGGGCSWQELAEIALWASGAAGAANLQRIFTAAETINNSSELPSGKKERAEFILGFMHRNILRTYSLYQTRIDTIFTNGRFNCVSSAVLYVILCESAGIETSGVITRDHAFVTIHIDGQDTDVETTNRYGFDPGSRREFHDQFGTLTGFSYVPARNYRDRQTIGKIQLVSLILNNRISELERASRFAEAVPLAIDRTVLLLGDSLAANGAGVSSGALFHEPRTELTDRLLNYGTSLLRANREEDALRWAAAASANYPEHDRWNEFIQTAVNNRIARFLTGRDLNTSAARIFLEEKKSLLSAENYARLDTILVDAELLKMANQIRSLEDGNSVVSAALNARDSGRLPERRANELIVYSIQRTAAVLCAPPARNWRAAIQYIETSLNRFGANRELEQALNTYRNNLATEYHNRFAAEWNRRNFDEAMRILNEGLAEFPNDRQLLSDRETVNRNRN